jgi:hypothetical protein
MLRKLVINLSKEPHFRVSNHRMSINYVKTYYKEEETIHQLKDDMDIKQNNSLAFNVGQEEANIHRVFD